MPQIEDALRPSVGGLKAWKERGAEREDLGLLVPGERVRKHFTGRMDPSNPMYTILEVRVYDRAPAVIRVEDKDGKIENLDPKNITWVSCPVSRDMVHDPDKREMYEMIMFPSDIQTAAWTRFQEEKVEAKRLVECSANNIPVSMTAPRLPRWREEPRMRDAHLGPNPAQEQHPAALL